MHAAMHALYAIHFSLSILTFIRPFSTNTIFASSTGQTRIHLLQPTHFEKSFRISLRNVYSLNFQTAASENPIFFVTSFNEMLVYLYVNSAFV